MSPWIRATSTIHSKRMHVKSYSWKAGSYTNVLMHILLNAFVYVDCILTRLYTCLFIPPVTLRLLTLCWLALQVWMSIDSGLQQCSSTTPHSKLVATSVRSLWHAFAVCCHVGNLISYSFVMMRGTLLTSRTTIRVVPTGSIDLWLVFDVLKFP